jgi:hypothetical protein
MQMKSSPSVNPVKYGPPLKPHKGWAIGLFALFVVWMIVLWAMYFQTVYPMSHQKPATNAHVGG